MAAVEFTTEELSQVFDEIDADKDGKLNRKEIATLLEKVNIEPTRLELDYIFSEIDTDKSGLICRTEFFDYMKSPPAIRTTLNELMRQFRAFDEDGDGIITLPELESILHETSDLNDRAAIKAMFDATDTNNDGRITFQEFVAMMKE